MQSKIFPMRSKEILSLFLLLLLNTILQACHTVNTKSIHTPGINRVKSSSLPVHLSFFRNESRKFYFILRRDSAQNDYKLVARWHSPDKKENLFAGMESTLKFLVNYNEIMSFKPIKRPKRVAYDPDSNGRIEEAIFSLSTEEMLKLTYAKSVTAEITGKFHVSSGRFNRLNSFRAFHDFMDNSN